MNKNCSCDQKNTVLPPDFVRTLATCLGADLVPRLAAAEIPDGPGAYVLLIELAGPLHVATARRAPTTLDAGWYAYCGSARGPGGLRARLGRHLAEKKTLRWHVDRLTLVARHLAALPVAGNASECSLAARLFQTGAFAVPMPGFGSSDCRTCPSHLLKWQGAPDRSGAPW